MRDRETQKCCGLLNETQYFTIIKIKDPRLTKHLRERERERGI